MRTYKMYAAVSATANAIASIQILRTGRLRGLRWAVGFDSVTDSSTLAIELSFSNVSQITSNNTIGVVDEVRSTVNIATSGSPPGQIVTQRLLDMPINAGEILYINAAVGGTLTAMATLFLDIEER